MDQMLSVLLRVVCVPLSSLFFCKTEQINALVSPFSPHCLYDKHFLECSHRRKEEDKINLFDRSLHLFRAIK